MSEVDVLIVGAGPTGLTLAIELAARNVSFRIVESRVEVSDKSRALVVQPRTQELLYRYGDVQELISRARQPTGIATWINQKPVLDITFGSSDGIAREYGTDFPRPLLASQAETERFLSKRLEEVSEVFPERGITAQSITQDETGVSVALKKGSQVGRLRCKYVVGADGSNSTVREAGKRFQFKGAEYPQEFLLCDCRVKWKQPQAGKAMFMLGQGSLIVIPLDDDVIRLAGSSWLGKTERDPTLQDFQDQLDKMAPDQGELFEPIWLSKFHLSNRGVNSYRDGRLFLAGDSAHVHSPAGGQGMNTGIQDSINLGWKLAEVLKRRRDPDFLDTYNNERSPVGKTVLARTDRIFTVMTSQNFVATFLRNYLGPIIQPLIFKDSDRWKMAYRFSSQLQIRYRKSDIVATGSSFTGPVRGGDRAPNGTLIGPDGQGKLHDIFRSLDYQLLLFTGLGENSASEKDLNASAADCGPIDFHIISSQEDLGYFDEDGSLHKLYGFDSPGYVYVRPDAYVEHIGLLDRIGELETWMKDKQADV
ncbi:FAD binding domain-containing protein [Colletotrichum abscissum]|uniref:FAD binding domain-containing protein n=1 Tax=Colletotrichum abscissum TaxID=1671311 RepID=A0A9P9XPQ7_9PEZI|nr:FAD binding domain-containing protein [Colletotrichum abscissum]KAI3557753.1 FAD binding domain-containing protein [Colletotrichum abscissum]KAK1510181.1 FAD binding domain-containing protein [Colletotrichum abscissum]